MDDTKKIQNPRFEEEPLEETGFQYTLSLINGKYKMTIIYCIHKYGVIRFNELRRCIGTITFKTLSNSLKELEADQLVHREEYPQIPPKVEYSLTERGKSLIPILDCMCDWGAEHRLPARSKQSLVERPVSES